MNNCNEFNHTILCVDDEESILNVLKRVFRKEKYHCLTASNGSEGLKILEKHNVHLIISDQRMPIMSGIEFLSQVKTKYPDIMRIILTGYTEVDSITEAVNKGHIYKFILKPWNDENLRLEVKQALMHYDLIQANKKLHEYILKQNKKLKILNEELEKRVKQRTKELEIRNQALEISQAVLNQVPLPIIGISTEGMIVQVNKTAHKIKEIGIGKLIPSCFDDQVISLIEKTTTDRKNTLLKNYNLHGIVYDIFCTPLSGQFCGKGVILILNKIKKGT